MGILEQCPICNKMTAKIQRDYNNNSVFCYCENCGAFVLELGIDIDMNKLSSFLYYNSEKRDSEHPEKTKVFVLGTINTLNEYKVTYPNSQLLTKEEVYNWYPKTFSEKVDNILLKLSLKSDVLGEEIEIQPEEQKSLFFVLAKEGKDNSFENRQIEYIIGYCVDQGYMYTNSQGTKFQICPKGYQRIDELQKKISEDTKNVFVAMSFAKEMDNVRTAIKNAIIKCGYIPRIMDEIEHNHQIVPEMLYEIRQSKFLIAELTGHNNGAYFEEGYALGYGKEVIQLCNNSAFGKDGHFDVKQVNTVLWDEPDDLEKKLEKRIKATID